MTRFPQVWATARGDLRLQHAAVMGIVNVTPDSFWDGGRHHGVTAVVRHAATLVEGGADVLDVGGESTRPGARTVDADEELRRVVPVIEALVKEFPQTLVSVDTVKAGVAAAALDAGAAIINDVSALRADPAMASTAARAGAGLVLMHSRGGVEDMAGYTHATYGDDVTADVLGELDVAVASARAAGVADRCIVLDPGLGFAKRAEHSTRLLAEIHRVAATGFAVMAGPSRKRFIGAASGGLEPEARLPGTLAACVIAFLGGARIFRVHDVSDVRRALDVAVAVNSAVRPDLVGPTVFTGEAQATA